MKPRPFEEWIEKGHQRDANLCGACARPTDERSLVRGGGGYNQALLYTLPRGVGVGCVRVLMEWVVWMWRIALSIANTEAMPSGTPRTGSFTAKIEMAMRWSGVGGEEVGVKCGCMQGCCVCAKPGVTFWRSMVQVAVGTKTNRVGAAARQSRTPIIFLHV